MDTITAAQIAIYRRSYQERIASRQEEMASRQRDALRTLKTVVPAIAATIPSVEKVYLFGSLIVNGRFHEHSDIDIGVIGATAVDYFAFWKKLEEAILDWTIDLRDASGESLFASRVRETGLLIYERTAQPAAS